VEIPFDALNPATLNRLVESFVLREGTDYGPEEVELTDKVGQVMAQLRRGEVLVVYDAELESATLLTRSDWLKSNRG